MKNALWLLPVLMLACVLETPVQPLPTPSATVVPSATVSVAQTNAAYERDVLNAQLTNVAYEGAFLASTEQAARFTQESGGWTATAAEVRHQEWAAGQTNVPVSQTALMVIQEGYVIRGTELAMTLQAPTLLVMQARAQAESETERMRAWGIVWMMFALPAGLLMLLAAVWRRPVPVAGETFVHLPREGGADLAFVSEERAVQLGHLARGLKQGKKLRWKDWEFSGTPLPRPEYADLRQFLADAKWVTVGTDGELNLTPEGDEVVQRYAQESSV